MEQSRNFVPKGNSVLSPYLMVESVEDQMEFLVNVFNAQIKDGTNKANGFIQHAELKIGDTSVMMGRAGKDYPARQSMNFIYVKNVDETHAQALKFGASEIMAPADRPYGNRESGFTDSFGNQWWIAHLINNSSTTNEGPSSVNLIEAELQWNKLIAENDTEGMAEYMSDDWILFSGDCNITTKDTFLKSVKSQELRHTKMDFKIVKAKLYGETGIVMQKGTSAGLWNNKPFSYNEIATSVLLYSDGKWKAVLTMLAPAVNPTS